ncbi:hypothetical protein GWK16_00115 [Roseomonas sp. JC162]|uniref:Uncharacterized protein n=1 Tax=Neoroseomonas marina TaxID=1232220 RepID=A0A848E8T9_9PROT|nr:hypothetical protein [Neoroseomonas marina]NMJ39625.1 hypothetical protein [Neoroseomonas marina]
MSPGIAALLLSAGCERRTMLRDWPRADAEVVAVVREHAGKGGPFFDLELRAALPDGR